LAEKRNESINKLLDGAGENSDAVFVSWVRLLQEVL
jgi:hypothetical protein